MKPCFKSKQKTEMYSLTLEKCKTQKQKCLLLSWRPEVRNQSVSTAMSLWRPSGGILCPFLGFSGYWKSLVFLDLPRTILVSSWVIALGFPVCLFFFYLPKLFSLCLYSNFSLFLRIPVRYQKDFLHVPFCTLCMFLLGVIFLLYLWACDTSKIIYLLLKFRIGSSGG